MRRIDFFDLWRTEELSIKWGQDKDCSIRIDYASGVEEKLNRVRKENYGKIPKIRKYFYLIRYGESIGAAGEDV